MTPLVPKSNVYQTRHEVPQSRNTSQRNFTSPCIFTDRAESIYAGYAGLFISFVIICQSAVTIGVICRTPVLHTNQNIFLVSLTLVDIIVSLTFGVNVCFHLSQLTPLQININLADTILFGLTFGAVILGAIHMGIIACERYMRIAYPFFYMRYMTKQRIFKILLCAWIPMVINSIIPVIFYRQDKYHIKCINTHPPLAYFSANAVIMFLNIIIVILCYSKIASLAIKHNKSANARRLQTGTESGDIVSKRFSTTLLKSIKFCVIMCGIYFACCLPPFITLTMSFTYELPDLLSSSTLFTFSLHAALNFFISCRMNQSFFQALTKMLRDFKVYCFCRKTNILLKQR